MALKAVFLDAGGTLVADRVARAAVYAETARKLGRAIDEHAMNALLRRVLAEMPRTVDGEFRYSEAWFARANERVFGRELGLDDAAARVAHEELIARFGHATSFRAHAGAAELLAALRDRGLVVGVVSNWSERLERVLAGLGLRDRLDFVLASAKERCEKPEPAIFRRALELARVAPNEALHAGNDLEKDVRGARNAGLDAVLVDHAGEFEPCPFPRVRNLVELRTTILERID
ncbi:MAG: HAD-IA family hydrolase [Planctomycetes bacterium]|nr:HAD-IA family hydrolase [Planctomycetota bacterium]